MPAISKSARALPAAALLGLLSAGGALAQVAPPTPVEETTLARDAFATGTLTRATGALEGDLWRGADARRLRALLAAAPARPSGPAMGEVLRRTLLSPGTSPEGAGPALGGAKLLALVRAGFIEEARTIASLSSAPRNDPAVSEALATADLLAGATGEACRRNANLASGRDDLFWVKLRVLCYAAVGERDAADLTLTLLREQGSLGETDEILLGALASGVAPKTPPAPEAALHLAALRHLDIAPAAALLDLAEAGVLKAIAGDDSFDTATRIIAAQRAASMGALDAAALKATFAGVEIDSETLGRAGAIAAERPGDPATDVALYQSVQQMTAPEFLRDKAARIASALAVADSFPRFYAASLLYADEIRSLEGALLSPGEASRFALARMAAGDGGGASRWLFTMLGAGGLTALDEELGMEMIELTSLLSVLDPISAAGVAEAAGVSLSAPSFLSPAADRETDEIALARIVEAAFDAAMRDIRGQAALAALAAADIAAAGDPVADVVIAQSLRAAGLDSLRRRMAFERALRGRFDVGARKPAGEEAAAPPPTETRQAEAGPESDGLTPRLKPPVGR